MQKTRSSGFTLIELLVVIAIIGILSAVVLASLSTARQKGQDAAIQANLKTIQTQAEIFYGEGNTYGTAASCSGGMWDDTTVDNAVSAIDSANGGSADDVTCHSVGTAYAASSALVGTTGNWCVDSTGFSGVGSAQTTGVCG